MSPAFWAVGFRAIFRLRLAFWFARSKKPPYRRQKPGPAGREHADLSLAESTFIGLPAHGMTPGLAEGILALDFPEADAARIEGLNIRTNEGHLTDDEQAELEAYINVSDGLAT